MLGTGEDNGGRGGSSGNDTNCHCPQLASDTARALGAPKTAPFPSAGGAQGGDSVQLIRLQQCQLISVLPTPICWIS